jgi:hypothetical protein
MLAEKVRDLGLDRLGQQSTRPITILAMSILGISSLDRNSSVARALS